LALASLLATVASSSSFGPIPVPIPYQKKSNPHPQSHPVPPHFFVFGFLVFVLDRVERRAPLLTAHNSEIMTCHLHCSLVLDFIVFDGPEEEGQALLLSSLRSPRSNVSVLVGQAMFADSAAAVATALPLNSNEK